MENKNFDNEKLLSHLKESLSFIKKKRLNKVYYKGVNQDSGLNICDFKKLDKPKGVRKLQYEFSEASDQYYKFTPNEIVEFLETVKSQKFKYNITFEKIIEQKYDVTVQFTGTSTIEIKATNKEEAIKKGYAFMEKHLGEDDKYPTMETDVVISGIDSASVGDPNPNGFEKTEVRWQKNKTTCSNVD